MLWRPQDPIALHPFHIQQGDFQCCLESRALLKEVSHNKHSSPIHGIPNTLSERTVQRSAIFGSPIDSEGRELCFIQTGDSRIPAVVKVIDGTTPLNKGSVHTCTKLFHRGSYFGKQESCHWQCYPKIPEPQVSNKS